MHPSFGFSVGSCYGFGSGFGINNFDFEGTGELVEVEVAADDVVVVRLAVGEQMVPKTALASSPAPTQLPPELEQRSSLLLAFLRALRGRATTCRKVCCRVWQRDFLHLSRLASSSRLVEDCSTAAAKLW